MIFSKLILPINKNNFGEFARTFITLKRKYVFMPIVEVKMWKGISEDSASKIISGITQVFVDMGIPAQAVEVVIQEIPKTNWGMGGRPFSITRPDENPP